MVAMVAKGPMGISIQPMVAMEVSAVTLASAVPGAQLVERTGRLARPARMVALAAMAATAVTAGARR
jgi:hypothetical protein